MIFEKKAMLKFPIQGLWTGVRNFIRPFRGVHKKYLAQYIAMFENAFNFKEHFIDRLELRWQVHHQG